MLDIFNTVKFSKTESQSICSLKLECEKLAQEKTEIQRQYIMVSFYFHFFNSGNLIYFDVELLNMSLPKIRLLKWNKYKI